MTNVLSPGDRVLMSRFGQFSHLWVDMAERLGFEVDVHRLRVGNGRAARALCREAEGRQGAPHQGGLLHAERDRHRRHQRRRRLPRRARRRQPPGAALRRWRVVDRLDRFPPGGMGRRLRRQRLAERLHAARRPRLPVGQQEGAGGLEDGHPPALLLLLRGHDPRQRHRLFPLYAGDAAAARPARLARPDRRGRAREHLRPSPPPRRRRAQGGRRLGPEALRQGAEMALRYGQRHPRAGRHRQRRRRQARLPEPTRPRSAAASTRWPARSSASAISAG